MSRRSWCPHLVESRLNTWLSREYLLRRNQVLMPASDCNRVRSDEISCHSEKIYSILSWCPPLTEYLVQPRMSFVGPWKTGLVQLIYYTVTLDDQKGSQQTWCPPLHGRNLGWSENVVCQSVCLSACETVTSVPELFTSPNKIGFRYFAENTKKCGWRMRLLRKYSTLLYVRQIVRCNNFTNLVIQIC